MRLVQPRSPLLLCLLAGVLLLAGAPVAAARLNLRRPPVAGPVAHAPGVPAAAPSAAALARSLEVQTGLTPPQVTAVNVCAAPAAGRAACAAQALILRSDHGRVHPRVHAGPTFTQVFPRHASAAATAAQAAASAPAPGTPAYLQQAYDLSYLSQTAGAGDTVAIVDAYDDPNAATDLGVYRAKYGLPSCTTANGCFEKVNQSGAAGPLPSGNSSWENEESLDLDAVSALCPNCHIILVETNDNTTANLDAGIATAVSLGANQVSNSWSANLGTPENDPTFPGVSLIAATGDHGYPGAGTDAYPAALPGYTAAGGTTLSAASTAGNLRGYSESAWSLNSSGTGWGGASGCDLSELKPAWQTDTGCTGRSYADVSADANPNTGLSVYDSGNGGWLLMGGTSLATPLIAAFEAVTGVNGATARWAYADSGTLNDPTTGSSGNCAAAIAYICTAGIGYDGPTGIGSISGAIVAGAPGVGGPSIGDGSANTYATTIGATGATLAGGVYPNGLDTTYYWQYGSTAAYGQQTSTVDVGAGAAPAAASGQLTGLSPGVTYHYRLVAANSDGTTYGYDETLTTSTVTNVAPVNTTAPSIGGSALQGQTLSVSPGTWTPAPGGYTYQWQASTDGGVTWSNISGATGLSYQVAAGDLGAEIQVIVTATNAYGSSSAVSAPAGPVGSGTPVVSGQPVVSGSPDQGQVLSAVSTWAPSGTSYTYQWQGSTDGGTTWTNISGATGATYQLQATDLGAQIRVVIGAVNAFGTASVASTPVGPIVANAPVSTVAPTVTGGAQRTDTLTATAGSWSGTAITYSYQWQRSGDGGTTWASIDNANQPTYVLQNGDEGDSVRVLVTAANPSGITSAPSAGTPIVAPFPPANTAAPAITGTAVRGSALNATPGTWTGPGNQYTYQWQRDAGEGYVDITGATAARYTLGVADEGATVRVVVSATNPDGTISVPSTATSPVAAAPPLNTSAPTIAGTAQRGFTLSAGVGSWSGVDNAYAYQWQSSTDGTTWTNIAGATGSTYTLAAADEGTQLRVLISATNEDGSAGAASAPTAPIAPAPPAATAGPTISGSAQRGITLTSTPGTWTGIGNAYTLQWQRSADGSSWSNIPGATGNSYTLSVADEGDAVRLLVTASNPDATVSAASGPTSTVQASAPADTTAPVVTGTPQRSSNLIATVGAWSGIGNSYTCQWQRSTDGGNTWTDIAGATGWAYTVAVADEGAELRARVTATNADGPATAPSAPTAPAVGAPPVNTTAPTVAGAALRGTALASTEGAWSGVGNSYAYQWQRSADGTTWTNIAAATGSSYTLSVADEGDQVRLAVTATNPDATVSAASAPIGTVQASAPVNTAVPSIAGSAQRGIVLVSGLGTWNGIGNSYAYQWQRSADGTTWTNIAAATGTTYTLAVADEGDEVRLAVTATNADGTATATSAATPAVTASPPVNTTVPAVAGNPARGQTLSSTAGTWLGIGNGYVDQWQRSTDGGTTWTSISGATGTSYQVGVGDEGSQLRLVVYATNPDATVSAASAPTAVVPAAPPVSTASPAVTGTAARGNLLTATPGTWSGIGNVLAYQWQRSTDGATWVDIVGATSTTYTLGVGDEGAAIRVLVTASNPDGTVAAPSAPTATVAGAPPVNTVAPTIAGIARRGNALTATAGVWSGTGNQSTFQWQRSADGTTWANIPGAAYPSYTLQAADEGDVVRVLVTAINPDGTAAAPSQPTATVAGSPPVNTAAPTLLGTPQRTATLSGTSGSWTGAGNVLAYQWQRSADGGTTWMPIPGATASSYILASADEGDNVRLLVTATNPDGTVAAVTAPSATIQAAPPVNSAPPNIQGTPRLGASLQAQPGTWSPSDVSYTYAWQRGDPTNGYAAIAGATGPTYTLTAADVGETVRVRVTATNPDGSAGAASSATTTVAQPPVNLVAPAAPSGTLMAGDVLTPDTGMWDTPSTYGFTWLRCPAGSTSTGPRCTSVSGASTYTLTTADVGSDIAVTVTATSPGGSASATSALTGPVAGALLTNTAPPSITGDPQVPNTLYANPGSWSVPLTSASYDWERCDADGVSNCVEVAPATAHYTLSAADGGHTIVLVATVTSPGRTATAQSPPLTVSNQPLPQATVLPVVSGTPMRTYTLSATGGAWTNHPMTLAYQWQRCDAAGHNCQPIPGATQPTYQLTNADEGGTVAVSVTAANASGSNTAVSQATGVVSALLPIIAHAPGLSTLAVQQGVPVSVGGAGWQTTSGTTYATSWERCGASGTACQAIAGATASSYTPTAADVGHTLVGVITATDVDGSVPSPSPPSQVVLPAAPRWRDLPVLAATGGDVGDTLTITPGVFTGPPVTSDTSQVMRCTSTCVPVSSAARYTIASGDVGAILRVRETAANAGGTTVMWSASYVGPVASAGSGSAVLLAGQAVVRNDAGTPLAIAQVTGSATMTADALVAHARTSGPRARVVRVRRARRIRGRLRAWVCPVAPAGGAARGTAPPSCTRQFSLGASALVRLPASMTGRVRIVVVRRR
jgi:hypothetical protein